MKLTHRTNFEKIQTYLSNAKHYFENSQDMLNKKEFSKAGELLWGAIAETVKALHLRDYDKPIDSHNDIRGFLNSASSIYRKIEIDKWKKSSDNLHVNFYETYLDETTFLEEYENGKKLFAFLSSVITKPPKSTTKND